MTVADYQPFVDRMIDMYEGGYGWDAGDPGGPTKYGITCYDLAQYLGQQMNSMSAWAPQVQAMTLATAEIIYSNKYASACDFDDLNAGCDCAVFDFGVNSGPATAIEFAQIIVGTDQDGILGPLTLAAINNYDPAQFVRELCVKRMRFLRGLGTWPTFGNGWTNRIHDLCSYSLALIQPTKVAAVHGFAEKPERIPFAFAKGYPI